MLAGNLLRPEKNPDEILNEYIFTPVGTGHCPVPTKTRSNVKILFSGLNLLFKIIALNNFNFHFLRGSKIGSLIFLYYGRYSQTYKYKF